VSCSQASAYIVPDLRIYVSEDGAAPIWKNNPSTPNLTLDHVGQPECAPWPGSENTETIYSGFGNTDFVGDHDFYFWFNQFSNCAPDITAQFGTAYPDTRLIGYILNMSPLSIWVNGVEVLAFQQYYLPTNGFFASAGYNTGDASAFLGGTLVSVRSTPP
jgi:hypothetical protein